MSAGLFSKKSLRAIINSIADIEYFEDRDDKLEEVKKGILNYLKTTTPQRSIFWNFCKEQGIGNTINDLSEYGKFNYSMRILLSQALVMYAFERYLQTYSKFSVLLPHKMLSKFGHIEFYPILRTE